MNNSKLFLVLCLHRSGSSATAGVLHHLGVHMGDNLIGTSKYNLKGHYENRTFVQLNDEFLRRAGGGWSRPPDREKMIGSTFSETKIREFIADQKRALWGLKDPRTALTFELWKPYLKEAADITYIFVHRPFEKSARSLAERSNISVTRASKILRAYLINLNHYRHTLTSNKEDVIDVHYEDMLSDPAPYVKQINRRIGQVRDRHLDAVRDFLDIKLNHH